MMMMMMLICSMTSTVCVNLLNYLEINITGPLRDAATRSGWWIVSLCKCIRSGSTALLLLLCIAERWRKHPKNNRTTKRRHETSVASRDGGDHVKYLAHFTGQTLIGNHPSSRQHGNTTFRSSSSSRRCDRSSTAVVAYFGKIGVCDRRRTSGGRNHRAPGERSCFAHSIKSEASDPLMTQCDQCLYVIVGRIGAEFAVCESCFSRLSDAILTRSIAWYRRD
uniref:Putative secreted protein n=1 Tax=Anopheles marajoara TaxID=58244 RepID=A0A2M4C5J7_9DIPT